MTAALLTARDRVTIAAALRARLSARLAALGTELDVRAGGDAYMETEALAVLLASLESQAAGAVRQVLPDQATAGSLDAHGDTIQVPRVLGELDADYQTRQLARWQERLMAGTPADWVAAAEEVSVVTDAFAFVELQPASAGTLTLGCTTLVCRGAAQGDSPTNTRILSAGDLAHVAAYLVGTETAAGVSTSTGTTLRPVTAQTGNVTVEAVTATVQNVEVVLLNSPTHPWPWLTSHAIVASGVGSITIAGDYSALAGLPLLANVGTGVYRGGYHRATVTTAVYGGVNTVLTLAAALPAAPAGTIYPCPPNWEAIRDRVLDLFDSLSVGDTNPTTTRYPAQTAAPSTLYLAGLYDAIGNADGVLAMVPVAPAADVVPGAKAQIALGSLLVHE